MGIVLSRRVGSDPFYLSYEKSFDKIQAKETHVTVRIAKRKRFIERHAKTGNWVGGGSFLIALFSFALARNNGWTDDWSLAAYLKVLSFISCWCIFFMAFALILKWVGRRLDARDKNYLKHLDASRKKMLKDLKDSTHFDKTMELLRKFDPDAKPRPAPPQQTPPGAKAGRAGPAPGQAAAAGGGAALSGAAGVAAGMVGKLATLVGDDPKSMELQQARWEADRLREENEQLKKRLAQLLGNGNGNGSLPQLLLSGPGAKAPSADDTGRNSQPLLLPSTSAPLTLTDGGSISDPQLAGGTKGSSLIIEEIPDDEDEDTNGTTPQSSGNAHKPGGDAPGRETDSVIGSQKDKPGTSGDTARASASGMTKRSGKRA